MFLNPRVFPVVNPYLILKEGEGFELHFLILAFGQAYPFSYNVILLGRKRCVAGNSNRGTLRVILGMFFGGVLAYYLEEK